VKGFSPPHRSSEDSRSLSNVSAVEQTVDPLDGESMTLEDEWQELRNYTFRMILFELVLTGIFIVLNLILLFMILRSGV
jgi:hypothetical protein